MQEVEKITVAITPDMAGAVEEAVRSGEYATAGEVFQDALRLWKTLHERELEELRRLWREGVASGPGEDGPLVFQRVRQRLGIAPDED